MANATEFANPVYPVNLATADELVADLPKARPALNPVVPLPTGSRRWTDSSPSENDRPSDCGRVRHRGS